MENNAWPISKQKQQQAILKMGLRKNELKQHNERSEFYYSDQKDNENTLNNDELANNWAEIGERLSTSETVWTTRKKTRSDMKNFVRRYLIVYQQKNCRG